MSMMNIRAAIRIGVLVMWGITSNAYAGEKNMSSEENNLLDKMLSMEEETKRDDLPAMDSLTPDLTLPKAPSQPKTSSGKNIPTGTIKNEEDFLDRMLSIEEEKMLPDTAEDTAAPGESEAVQKEPAVTEEVEKKADIPDVVQTDSDKDLETVINKEERGKEEEKPAQIVEETEEKPQEDKAITLQDVSTQDDGSYSEEEEILKEMGQSLKGVSLMYSNRNYQKLRNAIIAYEQKYKGRDIRRGGAGIASIPERAPNFFLNSLLYISDDNWSVWLNHRKYTKDEKDTPIKGLKIEKVSRDAVHFVWKSGSFDAVSQTWRRQFKKTKNGDYLSPDNTIRVSISEKKVYFTLQPNQTFETYLMRISEGIKRGATLTSTPSAVTN